MQKINVDGEFYINTKGTIIKKGYTFIKKDNKKYTVKDKVIKTTKTKKGYVVVNLYYKGSRKRYYLHRLLAETFIPNPKHKPQVNHKNGIKWDNRIENLEWCTQKENNIHAVKNNIHGLQTPTKITNKLNGEISYFPSQREASLFMGQHIDYISDSHRRWKKSENKKYKWEQWRKQ